MKLSEVVKEMRETAKALPHHVSPARPAVLAEEECSREIEMMGRKINVMLTYAINGNGLPNTWNLSVFDVSGRELSLSVVAMLVRAFFGDAENVMELDTSIFPAELRAQTPKGYRQFFAQET